MSNNTTPERLRAILRTYATLSYRKQLTFALFVHRLREQNAHDPAASQFLDNVWDTMDVLMNKE